MHTIPTRPSFVERKVADLAVATYDANSTGVFTLLAVPVLGSDYNQRIGRKITLKSVYVRGYVGTQQALQALASAAPASAQQARMIILLDNQPNGAVPVSTDLLVSANPTSQLNLNNRDRFKILCDKTFVFDPIIYTTTATQAVASASRQIYNIKKYKKLNIESIFNATNGGTIADINSGALYMFWIGTAAAGNNDAYSQLSTRVRFVDQ